MANENKYSERATGKFAGTNVFCFLHTCGHVAIEPRSINLAVSLAVNTRNTVGYELGIDMRLIPPNFIHLSLGRAV
jgi:hypothetical protein